MSARSWGDRETADTMLGDHDWRLGLRRAELADIDFAGHRVLRSIRFVVRDQDWRTADTVVTGTGHLEGSRRWLRGVCCFDGEPVLEWEARLTLGTSLTLGVRARAVAEFERNRIGLIVLHGTECAGTPLEILHVDGSTEQTVFPVEIAPHQPAREVGGYRWQTGAVDCTLRLTGDIFEMEDQRNWTDASYKTYSTPLELPFPVRVRPGDLLEQSVELTCRRPSAAQTPVHDAPSAARLITPTASRLPTLQLGAVTAPNDPDRRVGDSDRHIGLRQPILVELPADESCWPDVLQRARRDAAGAALDVRIIADRPTQLAPVITELTGDSIARIAVYERKSSATTPELLSALRAILDDQLPGTDLIAGTRAHFTELNRTIDDFTGFGGPLTFSITPQMHDRTRAQVIESLPVQRLVAEQAVRLAAGRGLHIGPVTLRPRFNAVATTPFAADDHGPVSTDGYGAEQVPESTDPRQTAPGTAAWTVCSIAALAVPGVHSISYFEAYGPRGIGAVPATTRGATGVYPAGVVWDWITNAGPLIDAPAVGVRDEDGAGVIIGAIAQQSRRRRQLLIGNPGNRPVRLGLGVEAVTIAGMIGDETTVGTAEGTGMVPVTIPAGSTVRLFA